jgi:hypothetical protein
MTLVQRLRLAVLTISALALVPAALADPPRFTTINYPGAAATYVLGINPGGDIVGFYDDNSGEHGFALRAGTLISFDYPGATWTDAYGISPQGDIIGQYGLADNTTHGFLLRNGSFYPVEVPGPNDAGKANSMPFKISPDGTIIGCYHQSNPNGSSVGGTMHGFAMNADGVIFDSTAGTMHLGVNPSGDITGYITSDGRSYVISSDGVRDWFTFPGALVTRATDISATGDIVGWYKDSSGHFHGFLRRQGEFTSLDVDLPGVKQTRPYGTNAVGEIVGYYQDATGWHGFLLSRRGRD